MEFGGFLNWNCLCSLWSDKTCLRQRWDVYLMITIRGELFSPSDNLCWWSYSAFFFSFFWERAHKKKLWFSCSLKLHLKLRFSFEFTGFIKWLFITDPGLSVSLFMKGKAEEKGLGREGRVAVVGELWKVKFGTDLDLLLKLMDSVLAGGLLG